ncbi:MAG: hypothetical protein FJ264_02045 [Planctomycetes bacterium]|nr:hypothetical protein [Planctomycetota bacterium]
MVKKIGVVRGICLFGMMGMLAVGTGCAELKRLRVENKQLSDNLASLQQENSNLSATASRYEGELSRLENARKDLESKLAGTGATTRIKDGSVSIILPDSILFDPGQAKLRTQSKSTLKKIAGILQTDIANEMVRIEGHTDSDPIQKQKDKYPSNWELSTARASSVLHYMVDECGISPTRIYIAGFGQYQPVAENKTKAGKTQNRRVEIVIISGGG